MQEMVTRGTEALSVKQAWQHLHPHRPATCSFAVIYAARLYAALAEAT